jgi:hypothetical protein
MGAVSTVIHGEETKTQESLVRENATDLPERRPWIWDVLEGIFAYYEVYAVILEGQGSGIGLQKYGLLYAACVAKATSLQEGRSVDIDSKDLPDLREGDCKARCLDTTPTGEIQDDRVFQRHEPSKGDELLAEPPVLFLL